MRYATYSPDDNKLRLYSTERLDPETYAKVRAAGFIWAPKQDLFVAPMWTPEREDLLIELCGEIEDEDKSLVSRAEERAERFEGYQENRAADAEAARKAVSAIADNIPLGQPILVGHHSERHARKDAERIENGMRKAVKMWETSVYWQQRAAGAIHHAKYKERPDVRARRIKTIEADRRKIERYLKAGEEQAGRWALVDKPEIWKPRPDGTPLSREERAFLIAGRETGLCYVATVPQEKGGTLHFTAYDVLRPESERSPYSLAPRMTVDEVMAKLEAGRERYKKHAARWLAHYDNRLEYERAMLADAGGLVSDREKFEIGGRILRRGSWYVIVKVNPQSVSVAGHFASTVPFDEIKEYRPPEGDDAERVRQAMKLPPLCNYPGEGFKHMTKAELAAENCRKWSDFPKVGIIPASDKYAKHRVQQTRGGKDQWSKVPVYITDQKRTDPPPAEAQAPKLPKPERELSAPRTYEAPERTQFDDIKETLKAGVKVVVAPQLFPTPAELAARMVDLADLDFGNRVLEPSAGTGNIVDAILRRAAASQGIKVEAVEINRGLCDILQREFPLTNIKNLDFLQCNGDLGKFDRIIMNPPFSDAEDIKHIQHALKFLNPGGRLVALCANGPRQQAKLKPLAEESGGSWEDLPAGTFKESGTGVNAALLVIEG